MAHVLLSLKCVMGAAQEMQVLWYLEDGGDVQAAPGEWGRSRSPPTSTKQQNTSLEHLLDAGSGDVQVAQHCKA